MRLIQFEIPNQGRRVGIVEDDVAIDVTSVRPEWTRMIEVFQSARGAGTSLPAILEPLRADPKALRIDYAGLLGASPGGSSPFLHPPLDQADPHRVLVTGTGLTHTGGMKSRDQMHGGKAAPSVDATPEPLTDSAKMFRMGLEGGKPEAGCRGVAPEWFYKGNGTNLRGPNAPLDLPSYALDGGEEPELVGLYVIDDEGAPWRLGFALGNEWSDHATEKINYLYLAPSKLRTCAVGPELVTGFDFRRVSLRCTVRRGEELIYDSGELFSGEEAMCHSLANCEDHHFKYPQHRTPGDVHVHFFGTSQLSYSTRDWKYQDGDIIRIEAPGFSAPLTNRVVAAATEAARPIAVRS